MPAEVKKEIELEIAHLLFIDIVAYSTLSINEQYARFKELNENVRQSEQFRKAEAAKRGLKDPYARRHGAGLLQEPGGTGMLKGQRKRFAPKI
jgi:hypothetical protein